MPKNRPLIQVLGDIHKRLTKHQGPLKGADILERYNYFRENSDRGADCVYARKCANLFLEHDLDDELKEFILEAASQIQENDNEKVESGF